MENVLEVSRMAFREDAVLRLSSVIHESQIATKKGLDTAVPASLAGLATHAARERGARELLGAFQGGNYPHVAPWDLSGMVDDPAATARLAESGEGFLMHIFGDRLESVVEAIATQSGVSRASAHTLLGLAAPLVLDAVGKETESRHLDALGLSRFLNDQGSRASAALPGTLASTVGTAAAAHATDATVSPLHARRGTSLEQAADLARTQRTEAEQRRGLPIPMSLLWVLAGLALLALLAWALLRLPEMGKPAPRSDLPAEGAEVKPAEPSPPATIGPADADKTAGTAQQPAEPGVAAPAEQAGEAAATEPATGTAAQPNQPDMANAPPTSAAEAQAKAGAETARATPRSKAATAEKAAQGTGATAKTGPAETEAATEAARSGETAPAPGTTGAATSPERRAAVASTSSAITNEATAATGVGPVVDPQRAPAGQPAAVSLDAARRNKPPATVDPSEQELEEEATQVLDEGATRAEQETRKLGDPQETPAGEAPEPALRETAPTVTDDTIRTFQPAPAAAASAFGAYLAGGALPPRRFIVHDVSFATGSATLPAESRSLDQAARALRSHPNANVLVEGYADPRGEAGNTDLSLARAQAVERYLVARGVPDSQLRAVGLSHARPLEPEAAKAARANRRVELVVLSR